MIRVHDRFMPMTAVFRSLLLAMQPGMQNRTGRQNIEEQHQRHGQAGSKAAKP